MNFNGFDTLLKTTFKTTARKSFGNYTKFYEIVTDSLKGGVVYSGLCLSELILSLGDFGLPRIVNEGALYAFVATLAPVGIYKLITNKH